MPTAYPDLFAALAAPFDPSNVRQRTQGGSQISYITARTAMNRLDDVLGPENWWDTYTAGSENSILCALTIRLPDGSTVTKADAGGFSQMSDAGDGDKSGYSDAFKRAAVKFLVGRYLYRDGVPPFGPSVDADPDPEPEPVKRTPPPHANGNGKAHTNGKAHANGVTAVLDPPKPKPKAEGAKRWAPANGREFYPWLCDRDKDYPGLFREISNWAAQQSPKYPVKITSWNPAQTTTALEEATYLIRRRDGAADRSHN